MKEQDTDGPDVGYRWVDGRMQWWGPEEPWKARLRAAAARLRAKAVPLIPLPSIVPIDPMVLEGIAAAEHINDGTTGPWLGVPRPAPCTPTTGGSAMASNTVTPTRITVIRPAADTAFSRPERELPDGAYVGQVRGFVNVPFIKRLGIITVFNDRYNPERVSAQSFCVSDTNTNRVECDPADITSLTVAIR